MKIKRIVSIKEYKSFIGFEWQKFCKSLDKTDKRNPISNETNLSKFNVIFGENGSGKSAICCILKSLSDNHNFTKAVPGLVEIEIDDSSTTSIYKFENSMWDKIVPKDSIIFFDNDFIDHNIHTHGRRENTQAKHSQNSGKLIIDLDQSANILKLDLKELKEKYELFKQSNSKALSVFLLPNEQMFFKTYSKLDDASIEEKKAAINKLIRNSEKNKSDLRELISKYSQIALIQDIKQITLPPNISAKTVYVDLFSKQIKEKAYESTDGIIKNHFEKHRAFIESARREIPEHYEGHNCPLCMQPLSNAKAVIEFYRKVFDRSYEIEKQKYLKEVENLVSELLEYRGYITNVLNSVSGTYNQIEKLSNEFNIDELYDIQRKESFIEKVNIAITLNEDLDKLIKLLKELKSIERNKTNIENLYDSISSHRDNVHTLLTTFNSGIDQINKKIWEFKSKYRDKSRIDIEQNELIEKMKKLNEELDFINTNKVRLIKEKDKLMKEKDDLILKRKNKQVELTKYLSETIPSAVLDKMLEILEKFNLSFTLEQLPSNGNTKDYTFAFRVKDVNGNERELKDGLSEGERQLISLSFFFSYIEKIQDKTNKIIIFDDPITSLDSPNLKILADLLHTYTKTFGQVIVLTHHPLFQKYLAKCVNPNPAKFGILKNNEQFGGSFIFSDPGYNLNLELMKCNEEINQKALTSVFQPEEIALKYGQLLRLSVEKFIKNELLMWDREKDFEQITDNLKQSRSKIGKLTDMDLKTISNIYKYCNYSNLMHADKENPSTLNELQNHIALFVGIINKISIIPK